MNTKRKEKTEQLIKFVEEIKDDEGFAVVDLRLPSELYDPLSTEQNRDLSDDIYDFIDKQANIIPANIPLKVRMHGSIPSEEQDEIRRIMKRHYTMKTYDLMWDMASNTRKMIALTIFGVLVLAAYFYFALSSDDVFFAEILSIVGSFSLWEAADSFLLERPRLRREHRNINQNINQIIEFVDD